MTAENKEQITVICDHTIMLGCKECWHSEKHIYSDECDFICPIIDGLANCVEDNKNKNNKNNKNIPFQLITVGEPICDGWIKEADIDTYAKFDFYTAMGQLIMYIDRPSLEEIKSVESGDVKLGMTKLHGILFLTWQFGEWLRFETPYNVHLRLIDFEFAKLEEGYGYGIQCILVDSSTGIVKAMRVLGTSKEWSDDFRNLVKEQYFHKLLLDKEKYKRLIESIYSEYSTEDIISMGKIYDIKWKKINK